MNTLNHLSKKYRAVQLLVKKMFCTAGSVVLLLLVVGLGLVLQHTPLAVMGYVPTLVGKPWTVAVVKDMVVTDQVRTVGTPTGAAVVKLTSGP